MEKVKKYFEFSGTISGVNYFLRNLLSTFVAFIGGTFVGYGIADGQSGMVGLGFLILAPAIWFSIATIFKRASALFPKNATAITVGLITAQLLSQFTEDSVGPIVSLVIMVFGLYMIFKNSNIENHEG